MTWLVVVLEGLLAATIVSDAFANELVRLAAVATAATVLAGLVVRWVRKLRRGWAWVRDFGRKAMEAVEELGHLAAWRKEVDDRLAQGSSRFEDLTKRVGRLEDSITPDVTVRHTFSSGPQGAQGEPGPRGEPGPAAEQFGKPGEL